MEAIVITFEGKLQNEQECLTNIARLIMERAKVAKVNTTTLHHEELVNILVKSTMKIEETAETNPKLAVIESFCKKIIATTGSPSLKTKEIMNRDICSFLVRENREVIAAPISIIAKVNNSPIYDKHREILAKYGLSALPQLLRDINPIFKFF